MFLWNDRHRFYKHQQALIDALPAPDGQLIPRITPFWHAKRAERIRRPDNSKPKRKDHRRNALRPVHA